jgi:hypothetical protein
MIGQGSDVERQRIIRSKRESASSHIDDLHAVGALWLGYRAGGPDSHLLARMI